MQNGQKEVRLIKTIFIREGRMANPGELKEGDRVVYCGAVPPRCGTVQNIVPPYQLDGMTGEQAFVLMDDVGWRECHLIAKLAKIGPERDKELRLFSRLKELGWQDFTIRERMILKNRGDENADSLYKAF